MPKRSFLFLQGVSSPFFPCLADRLAADGHQVQKINFNCGDRAYWGLRRGWGFRGPFGALPGFVEEKYRSAGVTDVVLFGDRRPVHRAAIRLARDRGIRVHVFEEGYFRPYWMTLERDGVNGNSRLPRDPAWFMEAGASLPDYADGEPFSTSLPVRTAHDVAYHLAGIANPIFYPRYRNHNQYSALMEYAGYARRFPMLWLQASAAADAVVGRLLRGRSRYFLLALQLNTDAQILHDSPFADMAEAMDYVMRSFAVQAPPDARLVIKNHPLDTGLENHARHVRALARHLDISGRVDYLEAGDLDALLVHSQGLITVNSTVGAIALRHRRPAIALSNPIYNLPGLTFQGPLDAFWRDAAPPDAELFRRFRNTVVHATQVNGGFYTRTGIVLAVENSQRILQAERSPLEALQ